MLSWDVCTAGGGSKDSSQCPYKGLGTGEAAEQPDSNTTGRSSEPSSGNSPKRNTSAGLQDLAFESVGMRKV